jgi:arsenite methyltransferase
MNLTEQKIKENVREIYSRIATQTKQVNASSCCGAGDCSTDAYTIMSDDYSTIEGYNPDADLGLGCGLPTQFAKIKPGDTVVDLGSGAGNDCFVARAVAGENGKIIGIDMTDVMINLARENAEKLNLNNVEFRLGEIEKIPVAANRADVVVSNCVLNLVPDKAKAFSEIFRILKEGGHFSISDIVLNVELPAKILEASEMYAGCVSGALQKDVYLNLINQAGFKNVVIQKEKPIVIPDNILLNYLYQEEIDSYKKMGQGILSITVYAEKPAQTCCTPGGGCC